MSIRHSILDTIGNTPVIRLNHLAPSGVNVFVKAEAFNPMGSVKDRLALGIIEEAEASGELKPGQTVIEATSGNTGIGLAMVCAAKGYPLVVVMAENFSIERRKLLRFLGARVVLTPAAAKGSGMMEKARELAEAHGWFLCRQFENDANARVHARTTAREILDDFADIGLDYFVTGFGTGGTLKGVATTLKQESPATQVIVCEPDNSAIMATGIPQQRNGDGRPTASHPTFRPHLMQGWSPDFIPKLAEDVRNLVDGFIAIDGNEALRRSRNLARKEGIFAGISSGATLAGALEIAATARPGSNILCMLPDTGERYLSTVLFENVAVEMTADEWDISRSTLTARFDVTSSSAPPPVAAYEHDQEAEDFIDAAISDPASVVMFAHQWCEFCWSVRKAFAHYGIPFRAIDLDSVEYQRNELGLRIRRALQARTECLTIPQLFVKGSFVGGCTEAFDAIRDASLLEALEGDGLQVPTELLARDPYSFLPQWLQPR